MGSRYRELRDYAEFIRAELLRVPNVGKVDLIGVQDEVVNIDISTRQLAGLGISANLIAETLRSPERGDRLRHRRDLERAHRRARERRAGFGERDGERLDSRGRSADPPEGHRQREPRATRIRRRHSIA